MNFKYVYQSPMILFVIQDAITYSWWKVSNFCAVPYLFQYCLYHIYLFMFLYFKCKKFIFNARSWKKVTFMFSVRLNILCDESSIRGAVFLYLASAGGWDLMIYFFCICSPLVELCPKKKPNLYVCFFKSQSLS